MEAERPGAPARDTGLPPGVHVGDAGRRFVAAVVDQLLPVLAVVVVLTVARGDAGAGGTALSVVALLVALAWGVLCWRLLAQRAASPGMRLMKLQLVGFRDGRPVGWGRALVRWLVFTLLAATGLGLLVMLVFLLIHPRRQGWHDLAADGVVIAQRRLAPQAARPAVRQAPGSVRPRHAAEDGARGYDVPADQAPSRRAPVEPASVEQAPVEQVPARPRSDDGERVAEPPAAAAARAGTGATRAPADGPGTDEAHPMAAEGGAPALAEPETAASPTHPARPVPADAPRSILEGWVAQLDDGREVPVTGLVLLGRNPTAGPGEQDAQLVKLADETRTVSKTHLVLGVDDAGLFVVDRGSTNGTTVTTPERVSTSCRPQTAVSVTEGCIVSMGDHWMRIRRDPA